MYILRLFYTNARENRNGEFNFVAETGTIAKWTILPGTSASLELLRLMTLARGGPSFLNKLSFPFETLSGKNGSSLQVEYIVMRHEPRDCQRGVCPIIGGAVKVTLDGTISRLSKAKCRHLRSPLQVRYSGLGSGCRRYLLLAYGPTFIPHNGTDCFTFEDAFHRRRRFHSLFLRDSRITDPVRFLERLHYRVRKGRLPAANTLDLLCKSFHDSFSMDTNRWLDRSADFRNIWLNLKPWQQRAILPIIDAARHTLDASPHEKYPLSRPGVLLFHRPDCICSHRILPAWITAMDRIFPYMQIIVSLSNRAILDFPPAVQGKRLRVPKPSDWAYRPRRKSVSRLPGGTVLLVDIDGRIPNLALMKLSRYFSRRGKKVKLVRHDNWRLVKGASEVYASCVFNFPLSLARTVKMRKHFGDSLRIGGSGVDLETRLPEEIESCPADYNLYPGTAGRAIGFLTRGCPYECPFCIVPRKEGKPRQVSELDELLQSRKKLVLLDDNILSHPDADIFLERMVSREIAVNFNQTLDIRLIDRARADLIRRIKCMNYKFTRSNYYFSLNDCHNLELVRHNYDLFGFRRQDNVQFVCMYGYNTTLAEDVKRFRFLRSLPGAYLFLQRYRPPPGGVIPTGQAFFDDHTDELIDELIGIVFPQNMKSMEQYYRWLSELYYEAFGKLHRPLVDTIFRYNYRDRKGGYLNKHPARSREGFSTIAGAQPRRQT